MNHIPQETPSTFGRSPTDELVNTATHGFGLALAVVGALVMAGGVAGGGNSWRIIGCGTYLVSLLAVYAMSTLSHGITTPDRKALFRRLDQGFIYLLIAATYTPFSLEYLRDGIWWLLLGAMWSVALCGFISKVFFAHRVEAVSVGTYMLLGWMPVLSVPVLMRSVPLPVFWLMLVGGACYSIGTLFLINDERVRHFHAVWHLCVIAGSACHFLGILAIVIGVGS